MKRLRIEEDPSRLLATFLETTVELTHDLDIPHVLDAIIERSMDLTGAAYGAAVTLTPDGEIETFQYRGLTEEEVAMLPHLPEGKGLLGLVISSREVIRLEDMQSHPESVGFPDYHVPMKRFLGVPLQHQDELVGALYLTKPPEIDPFTEEDEDFFRAMGAIATVGIANARLFSAERERAERSALMQEIASTVRRSLDVNEVLATTVHTLGEAAAVDRCFIRLAEEDGSSELGDVTYEWDAPGIKTLREYDEVQFPVSSLAATNRETSFSEDVMEDERLLDATVPGRPIDLVERGVRAVLSTPLLWGEELLGVVAFHSRTPRKWTESQIALIEAAAREVSIALNHAHRFGEAVEAAETLRRVDEMRSDFVAMVSHELRSPMTVVAGIADILKKRQAALTDQQRTELIDTLGREARRLTRLVSEVLDLEAIEQGAMELHLAEIDLAELAREGVTDAGAADRADLTVGRGNAIVEADADRIKQVLLNLISNATKFSEPDAPIRVTVAPEKAAVKVSVQDEGPGISEADQKRLFQRFTRLETSGNRRPGSGLGLYLSRSIVEAHGGEIWVDSVVGKGSTFSFRIPRRPDRRRGGDG
ncbi:MAG TPA: GAF domain-containing protein [Actinomycetota bacterium]|nr:GAF domain-containing protein [Actinomycetota bacterium]